MIRTMSMEQPQNKTQEEIIISIKAQPAIGVLRSLSLFVSIVFLTFIPIYLMNPMGLSDTFAALGVLLLIVLFAGFFLLYTWLKRITSLKKAVQPLYRSDARGIILCEDGLYLKQVLDFYKYALKNTSMTYKRYPWSQLSMLEVNEESHCLRALWRKDVITLQTGESQEDDGDFAFFVSVFRKYCPQAPIKADQQ